MEKERGELSHKYNKNTDELKKYQWCPLMKAPFVCEGRRKEFCFGRE